MADKDENEPADQTEADIDAVEAADKAGADTEAVELPDAAVDDTEAVELADQADVGADTEAVELADAAVDDAVEPTDQANADAVEVADAAVEDIDAVEPPDSPAEPAVAQNPRGRTSLVTMILAGLNLLAVFGFGSLLYLDIGRRQEWSRAVFLRDLASVGLPLDEKDLGTNPEAGTQLKHDLDPPLLKEAYQKRGGKRNDKFVGVQENFKVSIGFKDLDDSIVAKYFSETGVPGPVFTLQKEMARFKAKLPSEIDAVAESVAAKVKDKPAAEKRALLRKVLFPLCNEGRQVEDVNAQIEKTPDAKLGGFLTEAAKRRMWYDILKPLEEFRPSEKPDAAKIAANDPKLRMPLVDRAADLDKVKVEDFKDYFLKRCLDVLADNDWIDPTIKRNNTEKRRCVAFLLLAASQVETPGADRSLAKQPEEKAKKDEPKKDGDAKEEGEKKEGEQAPSKVDRKRPARTLAFSNTAEQRAKVVCGLRDFCQACEDLAIVTEIMEDKTVAAIYRDRGEFYYLPGLRKIDPEKFADQLIGVLQKLAVLVVDKDNQLALDDKKQPQLRSAVVIRDGPAFEDKGGAAEPAMTKEMAAFRGAVADRLSKLQGKIEDSESLQKEIKDVMGEFKVEIREDPGVKESVNKAAFELQVDALFNANAEGFLGMNKMAIQKLQKLARQYDRLELEYARLKKTYDEVDNLSNARVKHEQEVVQKLLESRAKTRQMALELKRLQDEMFLAQRGLDQAAGYNQYLYERLVEKEKKAKTKGAKGQ